MEWKQIELKWAEMARRIRADAHCGEMGKDAISQRLAGKDAVANAVPVKQFVAVGTKIIQKRETVSTH